MGSTGALVAILANVEGKKNLTQKKVLGHANNQYRRPQLVERRILAYNLPYFGAGGGWS